MSSQIIMNDNFCHDNEGLRSEQVARYSIKYFPSMFSNTECPLNNVTAREVLKIEPLLCILKMSSTSIVVSKLLEVISYIGSFVLGHVSRSMCKTRVN